MLAALVFVHFSLLPGSVCVCACVCVCVHLHSCSCNVQERGIVWLWDVATVDFLLPRN